MRPAAIRNACILSGVLAFSAAFAQPAKSPVAHWSVGELKAGYLRCSDATATARLPGGAVMVCSVVYEELKNRAFGGNFERLLAWARSQRPKLQAP